MGFGSEKVYKVFYYPREYKPGEFGTRVALISATSCTDASGKFKRQYAGEFFTVDHVVECEC